MTDAAATTVRRLHTGDETSLDTLMKVFGDAFEEPGVYADTRPDPAWHARLLGNESFVALVAEKAGEIVGGLTAYVLPKPERARSELYLYDLAVAASHRREGVATALIERLKDVAKECGAWMIFVQADPGDDPAIALYAKLGTREDVLHFDIAPGGGEPGA